MKIIRPSIYTSIISLFLLIVTPLSATAERATTITGSGDIGAIYQTNVYHTKSDQLSQWDTFISPSALYSSEGHRNNLTIEYNPTYTTNHRRNVYTFEHDLDASFAQQVSEKFNFEFTNNFSYINAPGAEMSGSSMAMDFIRLEANQKTAIVDLLFYDVDWPDGEYNPMDPAQNAFVQSELQIRYDASSPEVQAEVDGILQQSTDKNKFWDNTATFNGFYQFDRTNLISFGYTYRKLKNDADYFGNDDYHQPFISLQHSFSAELEFILSYEFESSTRELSDDSTSHDTGLLATYSPDHANEISVEYRNEQRKFDGNQSDQVAHRVDLAYTHRFNQQTTLDISVRPFLIDRDSISDERGYGLSALFTKTLKNSYLSLEARTNTSDHKSTGSWKPFRDTYLIRTNFDHNFTEKFNTDLFVSFGQTQSWYNNHKSTYSIYTGGLNSSYPLNKWLDIELEYRYTLLESDNALIDEADNNKIILRLSATNDFWRW